MPTSLPLSVLGLRVSGDIGPLTIYTDTLGRKVAYPIAPPKEPPSAAQLRMRDRFRQAHAAWKALSQQEKFNLEEACRRTSLCLTGKNLYISAALTNRNEAVQTVAREAGLALPNVPYIP